MPRFSRHQTGINETAFSKTIEFAGVFRNGTLATEPLSIEISYSPINAHPPAGVIRGTSTQFAQLESFFLEKQEPLCRLESTSLAEGRDRVRCRDIILRKIGIRSYPADEQSVIHQIIGHFEIGELKIEHEMPSQSSGHRWITFFLDGPSLIWNSRALRTIYYTGKIKSEIVGAQVTLESEPELSFTAQPYFHYAIGSDRGRPTRREHSFDDSDNPLHTLIESETFALTIEEDHLKPYEQFELAQ
jgi:hypothetical protein